LPILLSVLTSALLWRRLPFTSTSTWSGDRPRSCAARMWSAPPELDWRGKLNDGSSACSALPSSPLTTPALRMSSAVSTSTGEVDSSTVRSTARVPVTITVSRVVAEPGASCAVASWASRGEERTSAMARPRRDADGRDMRTPAGRREGGEGKVLAVPKNDRHYQSIRMKRYIILA